MEKTKTSEIYIYIYMCVETVERQKEIQSDIRSGPATLVHADIHAFLALLERPLQCPAALPWA